MLLRHPALLSGSWTQTETKLLALSGFDHKATTLHLKEKPIVDVKQKVPL